MAFPSDISTQGYQKGMRTPPYIQKQQGRETKDAPNFPSQGSAAEKRDGVRLDNKDFLTKEIQHGSSGS